MDPPDPAAVADAMQTLQQLGAIVPTARAIAPGASTVQRGTHGTHNSTASNTQVGP